jgi:hypothetical protein
VIRGEIVRHQFQQYWTKNPTIKSPGAAGVSKIQNGIKIEIDAYITLLPTEGIILIN